MTKKGEKIAVLFFALVTLLILFGLNLSVSSSVSGNHGENNSTSNISLHFFYAEGCIHCKIIEPTVKTTCEQYNVLFKSYEVYNVTNLALLRDFEKRYCISANESIIRIPIIFVGDSALIGVDAIAKDLRNAIKVAKEKNIHAETYRKDCPPSPPPPITVLTVIGAAIIDSINPCAMGVLIIFIMFMIYSAKFSMRRIAIYGSIYILFVYLTYFLAGVGILKFLGFVHSPDFIIFINTLVIAILLIGIFLAFRDVYVSFKKDEKKRLYFAIPESAKGVLEKYIKKGTLPSVIILGILVSMAELPCTGYVYLGILTILGTIDFSYGILLLAIYNLIFVLPLIIILFLALFGRNLSETFKTKAERSWLVRYLIGWLMIILAIFLINENFKILNFSVSLNIALSHTDFFIIATILIIVLFIVFSVIRPIVKKRINIWYCAYCYACALTWIFLTILYMLGVNVPKILIGALIGMSLTGIWEEFKKFNFRYFGLFTIFMIFFGMGLIYTLFIDHKFEFFLLVLIIFVMDGIIMLKNFEIRKISDEKDKFEKEIKGETKGEGEKETRSLREMLDHCCD